MSNKKTVAAVLLSVFTVGSVFAAESDRMSLQESLVLDSQIARAELQKKLQESSGRIKPSESRPMTASQGMPSLAAPVSSTPELEGIRGVGTNLRAWLTINGRRFVVREGDIREGWKVVAITSEHVKMKRGAKVLEVTFSEALSGAATMPGQANGVMQSLPGMAPQTTVVVQ